MQKINRSKSSSTNIRWHYSISLNRIAVFVLQTNHASKHWHKPNNSPIYHQHAGRARSSQFIFGLDGSRRPLVREWERSAS